MTNREHIMTLRQPATRWQDALPSGNGTVGALVYGRIRNEVILLNHEALWLRTPKPELPSVVESVPELRAMLAEGRYHEATPFLHDRLSEKGYNGKRIDPYHPAFDLWVEMDTRSAFTKYRRSLDFSTGEVTVRWTEAGTVYMRRLFVSRADDVVVALIGATRPGSVNCKLSLVEHSIPWSKEHLTENAHLTLQRSAENEWLIIRGRYDDGNEYGGLARIEVKGGSAKTTEDTVVVENADEVLVILKLYANENGEVALKRLRDEISGLQPDYDALLSRHEPLHREIFERVKLDLDAGEKRSLSNDELLMEAYDSDVPTALIERLTDFGRYLLISSSRPGGLPANLQGVWNGDYTPAWQSDFHNDENIQMNYWQALPGNMPETTLPYFDYYESWLDDYRTNARNVWGCRGIFAPISQSTHGLAFIGWDASINWTAGAGWLAQLFHDYWLFTGDREFLAKRAVPFLKEVALFYEDFCFEDERGKLVFSPSHSPENRPAPPHDSFTTINATMDIAIAKEVLANLCTACEELGIEQDGVRRWREMIRKLPDYEVNEDGAIKEWIHPDLKDNYHHRHQSHLYPLFPGLEVTEETDPALVEAVRVAVEKRLVIGLVSQTGWSLAHMANIYARLGNGDRALECMELITRACLGPNLFTYHNDWRGEGITMFRAHGQSPFQIDANFGVTAAVLEMLVYSKPGIVKLLPALPTKWPKGKAEGILCRGGIEVSVEWDIPQGRLWATLLSKTDQEVTVKFPAAPESVECDAANAVSGSDYGSAYRTVRLAAGKPVILSVAF